MTRAQKLDRIKLEHFPVGVEVMKEELDAIIKEWENWI